MHVTSDVMARDAERASTQRGLDDYARACLMAGQRLVRVQSGWWREVRPCFFRPILPFLEPPPTPVLLPWRSWLGGCQYPSRPGGMRPTSFLSYLVFDHAHEYGLEQIKSKRRGEVRAAQRAFRVTPLSNTPDLRADAHRVYLDFFGRTHYDYLPNRVRPAVFERWLNIEFSDPGLVALGAWSGERLVAVSLSRVVGDVWVYTSFFATSEALHRHVANLLLHEVRTQAATVPGVDRVFLGMQNPPEEASLDAFKFHHGAVVVRRPAVLWTNPVARVALSRLTPSLWAHLHGRQEVPA